MRGGKYEGEDGVELTTGCLKKWCANIDTLPTLSSLLEVSGESVGLMLQVLHVEEKEGTITITDGEAYCKARLDQVQGGFLTAAPLPPPPKNTSSKK